AEALRWFREAHRLGHPGAREEVERMSIRVHQLKEEEKLSLNSSPTGNNSTKASLLPFSHPPKPL
ncbi:unnamed protein product, partial [Heterosigma akashiwo]